MTELTSFCAALSDANRVRMLHLLTQRHKATPLELQNALGLSIADYATHLQVLAQAGLVKADANGDARLKHKHTAALKKLLAHFDIQPKKQPKLAEDLQMLKAIHKAQKAKNAATKAQKKKPVKKAAKKK